VTGHKRILIVDDDPKVLLVLQATLERMGKGYHILTAHDGSEALAMIEDMPFDLLVADIRMPGVNGIKLVETMRASNVSTEVIWIAAYGCHKLEAIREQLKVYRCLDKPLRIGEIRQAVLDALQDNGEARSYLNESQSA
jgi:DNA-binding NtrC family response regulator